MYYRLDERTPTLPADSATYFIAPNATVIGSVIMEEYSSVWFNAVIRGDNDIIQIGRGSNIQDGSVLHTDAGVQLRVGEGVTVGHQVMLHGCTIGAHSLIGIHSVILNHAVIGKHSLVGAYSLIPEGKTFADGVLIVGSPAKVKRDLTPEEIQRIQDTAHHYVTNFQRYLQRLQLVA